PLGNFLQPRIDREVDVVARHRIADQSRWRLEALPPDVPQYDSFARHPPEERIQRALDARLASLGLGIEYAQHRRSEITAIPQPPLHRLEMHAGDLAQGLHLRCRERAVAIHRR